MTPIDIGIAIATNFFTGCTQELLGKIDQKVAAARIDSDAWKERSKSLEQRITQQLNLAARSINYPKENLDQLAAILSDQVFISDTVNAFLDGRLQASKFAEEIASREPSFQGEPAVSAIAQTLLDTFTTAIAADGELSRIVGMKRSEGVKKSLDDIGAQVIETKRFVTALRDEQRALLQEIAQRTVLGGKPGEQLTPQQRYERALAEVASAHSITVTQLSRAIANFVARTRSDSAASDFDRALALIAEQDYAAAEATAERAVDGAEKDLQRATDAKRKALLLLGDIQQVQVKYIAAEKSYRAAYDLAKHQDFIYVADAGWRLSRVLSELGRYEEAIAISTQILADGEKGFDVNGVMVALNHLGLALQQAGRYKDAEPVLRRALELWESKSQAEDLILATHLHNFSAVLREQGRRSEAEPFAKKALRIRERLLGPDHPDVATCLTNVALLLDDDTYYRQAEQLLRRALGSYERFLGADHPYSIRAANNLGMNLKEQGRLDDAEPFLRRAMENSERVFGAEHPDVATNLNNFGELLLAKRNPREAAATFQKALAIHEKIYGGEHPDTQLIANNLGSTLLFRGEYRQAEERFRKILEIKRRVMPDNCASLANTLNNLGFALYSQRRFDEAEPYYREALTLREGCLPQHHPELGNSLGNLGLVLHETGRYAEAEILFLRELKIREQQIPASETLTAFAMNNIAAAQYYAGKAEDAEETLKRHVEYCRTHFGEENELTKAAAVNLSNVQARRKVPPPQSPQPETL